MKKGLIRRSITYSTYAVIFSAAFLGLTVDYVIPYALFLGASTAAIGVIASIPVFLASLLQLKTNAAAKRTGRKKLCVITSSLHAFLWLGVVSTTFLPREVSIPLFMIIFTLLTVVGSFDIPAWSSMMADLIPPKRRGSFFGWRMGMLGFTHIVFSAAGGFALSHFQKINPAAGFSLIFLSAMMFRFASSYSISRMRERPRKDAFSHFPFINFLKGFRSSNFARFTIFQAAMTFSVYLSAPYFAVYMLRDLGFSYREYMMVILAGTITIYSLVRRWGNLADDFGNVRVIKLTTLFLPVISLLWMFSHNLVYLAAVQVFSGFVWSGYLISSSNFIYDVVSSSKRACAIAYFNVINGTAICAGALLGGLLVDIMPPFFFRSSILAVFLLSTLCRLAARIFLAKGFSDVSTRRSVPAIYLFTYAGGITPLLGFTRGVQRVMRRIFSA